MIEEREVLEELRPLLADKYRLTSMEDDSAYLHLRLETDRGKTAELIKPLEERGEVTVISQLMTREEDLNLLNDLIQRLSEF